MKMEVEGRLMIAKCASDEIDKLQKILYPDLNRPVPVAGAYTLNQRGERYPVLDRWPYSELPSYTQVSLHSSPRPELSEAINLWRKSNFDNVRRGYVKVQYQRSLHTGLRLPYMYGALWLSVLRASGEIEELGLASLQMVTTAGVNALVDAWQGGFTLGNLKYHGLGTGSNIEDASDVALQTELTTQYIVNNTRATGTMIEGASPNIIRTVATNTVDAPVAVTEHGIFSQAATGGGVLWDRSVFAVINLAAGDSLQSTYDGIFVSGG